MSIFNHTLSLIGFFSATFLAGAADVSLRDESKLTGDLIAMDAGGTITLASPISKKPLLIHSGTVKQVNFSLSSQPIEIPSQRIRLLNGDVLPVGIETFSGQFLQTSSHTFGELDIPRDIVDSIQLGIFPESVVYSGTRNFSGWKRDLNGSRNWELKNNTYLATGPGTLSRELELPEKFVIAFTLSWATHPNFRISFADPLEKQGARADRYFLQFAGAGVEIKRESTGANRFIPIVMLNRPPEQFSTNRLDIEIRMDRSTGEIHLYLNGELEGRFTDPIEDIPAGNGISLISQAPAESEQQIRFLEVSEWHDLGDRHRTEKRGNAKTDSLIGRNGERFSGILQTIRSDHEGRVYVFKSDFQPAPIEIPEDEVSTVFIAKKGTKISTNKDQNLILHLQGNGEVHVSSCEFGENIVHAEHPLLGKIELQRDAITMLEQRFIPKAQPVKSQ
ncbi:hypothetical protein ACFSSA_15625 [Luteolibacter algae]|uniref:Uncharacterized protein n=1 Tax=Luteolibacter algae TaxID=454151 RepID=A0ABW5DBV6_9BACT